MRRELFDVGSDARYVPLREELGFVPYSILDPWSSHELRRRDAALRRLVGDAGQHRDGCLRGKPTWVMTNTASVFSPVVTEVLLRIWGRRSLSEAPEGHSGVFDPFAGGGTRAILTALQGWQYTGVELRKDEAERIEGAVDNLHLTQWVRVAVGDSTMTGLWPYARVVRGAQAPYGFVFTCPPYYDLEKYSKDPADLSNYATYEAFLEAIRSVFENTLGIVYEGTFAVWVVGNFLNGDEYVDFRGDAIRQAQLAGWKIHDIVVLSGKLGTAGQRVGNSWKTGRMVRRHEYAIVLRA